MIFNLKVCLNVKKDNLDKPVYETPKVSNLDANDEAQGQQGPPPCNPGSGAYQCQANGASAFGCEANGASPEVPNVP